MATLNWKSVQAFVVAAMTDFGEPTDHVTNLSSVSLSDLGEPFIDWSGSVKRFNYGIPSHELKSTDLDLLMNWFTGQYAGSRALKVQAKGYGGFLVNLTWRVGNDLFNFHVKINAGSMDMKTLAASGANAAQKSQALNAMFPPLGGK